MADEPADDRAGDRLSVPRLLATHSLDGGIPLTTSALDALNRQIADYAAQLVAESGRVARRHHSGEVISAGDVDRAIDQLGVRPSRRRAKIIGAFGSMLLGAAVGNVLQILSTPTVTPAIAILTFVYGVIGVAMMMYGLMQD